MVTQVVHRSRSACGYIVFDLFSVLRNLSQHFEILELSTDSQASRSSYAAESTIPQRAVGWRLEQESADWVCLQSRHRGGENPMAIVLLAKLFSVSFVLLLFLLE